MAFAKYWNNLWTVVFGSTALVITIANLVTVVVFLKQKLRKRSHFSLISLAIADLMVGALAVPLYVVVAGFQTDEKLLVVFFQYVDIFTGLLSIFTLASISLERMHSVLWPLRHRAATSRFYSSVVGIPWVLAALATSIRLLKRFNIISAMAFTVIIVAFLSAPSIYGHFHRLLFDIQWTKKVSPWACTKGCLEWSINKDIVDYYRCIYDNMAAISHYQPCPSLLLGLS